MQKTFKQSLRTLLETACTAFPAVAEQVRTGAEALLQLQPANETDLADTLERLEQLYVSNLRRPTPHFEGSIEDRLTLLCGELRAQQICGQYGHVVTVFDDFLIACEPPANSYGYYDSDGGEDCTYWKIGYTIAADNETVTFEKQGEVEIEMIFTPVDEGTAGEGVGMVGEQSAVPVATEPEWVIQGFDPPGGDQTLYQRQSVLLQVEAVDGETGVMKVAGVATTADVLNAMGEVYPLQVWQDNMPRLERLLSQGKLVGESMHPSDGRPTLDRTCVKFTELTLADNQVKFKGEILPTEPHGKNLQVMIQNGVCLDISSRGQGTMKTQEWNGVKSAKVVQRGFRCDAFDVVIAGASPGATINDWSMQSVATPEEDPDMKTLETIAASVETLAATMAKQGEILAALVTAKDEKVTAVEVVQAVVETPAATPAATADLERFNKATAQMEQALVRGRIEDLTREITQSKQWGPQWTNVYRKQIQNANAATLEALEQASERAIALVEDLVQQAPKFPGQGFNVQKDKAERGFETPSKMLDELCDGLEDAPLPDSHGFFREQQEHDGGPKIPDCFRSQKRAVRQVLENIARFQGEGWHGPSMVQSLWLRTKGFTPETIADQVLHQTCADGVTAVGAGGAPSSAIFIFPLIRRLYPQLIATELASVQPMDRPDGKIFYLDAIRMDGNGYTDEGGSSISNRMRIDRSDSFSDSYANDPGECSTANLIQLRLSSKTVTADTKKLYASWSIEEMQDLRAYHNLDVSLELVGALSREIALEWNEKVLSEMLAGATAGNLTYGTTAPSGYSQKEWDEYIFRYVDKASNQIFKQRHGDATHIVAGPDAWLKLSSTFRTGTIPGTGPNPEQFAGVTVFPMMGGTNLYKTYKTSFWAGTNSDKILVLRRGADWSDTPYVWAPYLDYVSNPLTLPDTFTQKQGIMSRVARKVVVGSAMSVVTIDSSTGVRV